MIFLVNLNQKCSARHTDSLTTSDKEKQRFAQNYKSFADSFIVESVILVFYTIYIADGEKKAEESKIGCKKRRIEIFSKETGKLTLNTFQKIQLMSVVTFVSMIINSLCSALCY